MHDENNVPLIKIEVRLIHDMFSTYSRNRVYINSEAFGTAVPSRPIAKMFAMGPFVEFSLW